MEKVYRYVDKNSNFHPDHKEFYEENGYIIFKNNVDVDLLDELQKRFVDICNKRIVDHQVLTIVRDPSLKQRKDLPGDYVISKIQDFLKDDPFFKYCRQEGIIDVVENIIGPNVTAIHSMLINKPPDADLGASLHPLHQDLHYFPFRPADKIVASWTAMEKIDESNGCLFVLPGTHRPGKLYQHEYPEDYQNKMYHGVRGFDHIPKVNVIMEKGDTVFFHPLLLHGSGPNKTKGFRKAISAHFADSNCHSIEVKGTTQEAVSREIEEVAEKKYGVHMEAVEIWKLKSRMVKGNPGAIQNVNKL